MADEIKKDEIESQVESGGGAGAEKQSGDGAGDGKSAESKDWTTALPKEFRAKASGKWDSLRDMLEDVLGEEKKEESKTTESESEKKPKKSLESELRDIWGGEFDQKLELAKKSIAEAKKVNPELVKRIVSGDGSLSADMMDLMATFAKKEPDVVSTDGHTKQDFEFKGVKNKFMIQGL